MDIATLIGFVVGTGLVVWGMFTQGSIMWFWDFSSVLIVIGGTIGATFISFPMDKVLSTVKVVRKAFSNNLYQANVIIDKIVNLANVARREGLLALEEAVEQIEDEFLKKGVMLIVDGTDPELVKNILETEISFLESRHSEGKDLFEAMATLAPGFGMIGTLIGLVAMLKTMSDPSAIGPKMSVALVTTLYGSLLANLVFTPIASKLKLKSKEEVLIKEIMIEGLLSIQAGENPRIIEEKLKAFLPPSVRNSLGESGVGGTANE